MIKRLVIHNIKHISYCTTNLILIAMFAAWPVYASANFKNEPDSLICSFATANKNGEKIWSTYQKMYVKEAKKRGLSCGIGSKTSISLSLSPLVELVESVTSIPLSILKPTIVDNSACSLKNLNVCSSEVLCGLGSHYINGKRIWDERSQYIKYSVEAKKRGLSCGVGSSSSTLIKETTVVSDLTDDALCRLAVTTLNSGQKSWRSFTSFHVIQAKKRGLSCGVGSSISTTKSPSVCSWHNLSVCTDDLVCQRGSRIINGKRSWGERSPWIKYSVEAKKRGLSCGVGPSSSTTKISSACPKNVRACSNDFVCKRGTSLIGGKKAWHKNDHSFYRYYSVEAKRRGLSCGVGSSSSTPIKETTVVSNLPDCPSVSVSVIWHNCFGTHIFKSGNKYVGEWKHDKLNGQGTFTHADGKVEEGTWKDAKLNGQGAVTYANGDKYVGEFKGDEINGRGYYIYSLDGEFAGMEYTGEWKYGKWNGQGALTYTDGSVDEGIWKDDVFQYAKSPTTKTPSVCSMNNLNACTNDLVCKKGSRLINGKRIWDERYQWNTYSREAKRRGLSCGVGSSSSSTKTSSVCSLNNLNACSDALVCSRGSRLFNLASSAKYSIEAKRRGLTCGVGSSSSTTKSPSVCSTDTLNACSNDLVCKKGSRLINGKRIWDKTYLYIKYAVEAKKRGLSCGVGSSSSSTKTPSVCALNNLNVCSDALVCANASIKIHGVRKWEERPLYFKYVVEAKKRGLSCGVCSLDNLNVCSSDLICQRGSRLFNGKRIWDERSAWIKYSVEAKKRGLSCGTSSTSAEPKSVSDLSNCPSNKKVRWNNCFGSYAYDNGNKYVGEWKDNQKTGQGTYTWKSGDIYVGEFKDDKNNGQGVLTYVSGDKYIGEFKNDSFYGQGTYTFKDGKVEEGNWKDGKLNGQGIVTYINGDIYVGEFKDDKMTKGTFTFGQQSDWAGDKYVGEYRDGKRHGQGTYTFADGTVKKGTWKDGELQSLEPAPVVPNKQPEAPTETASSLNDPLHIKIYGKTLHTLLLPNTLLFIGEIEDGDERGFRTALRAHKVDTVVLLSGGGLVSEGLRIANIINDKRLTTYVPVDETCASACSFMFFAGNPKVAHGRLGVHQFYVDDDEKKASIGKVQKGTQLLVADIIQNLTDFGTPASVFPKMFSTSGMYFFSETEKSAFSDRNKITPETVTKINEALSYLIKEFDNKLDDATLDGMPQKTKSTLIQLELIRIGCMEGPVDGIRGEATKSAIDLLSSKMKSKLSSNKFSDLFKRLNNTKVGACY